jgi:hypothetical protein
MSTSDRDPLDLLSKVTVPEPDHTLMNATIAESRAAFERRSTISTPRTSPSPRRLSLSWLLPVGIAAFAAIAAVIVAANLLQQPPAQPATGEVIADGSDPAAPAPNVRMGMRPATPSQEPASQSEMTAFTGDGITLGYKLTPTALQLYLPELSEAEPIDTQVLLPGEAAEILAAFKPAGRDIIAVQMRVDGAHFWRVYRPLGATYARDTELSAKLENAPDMVEAMRRLSQIH